MDNIEIIEKNGRRYVKQNKCGLPDIPRPYTIIFKTTVKDEFETIALTKDQYEKILLQLEKGASGIILNGNYYDRYSIFRVRNPLAPKKN